MHRVAAPLRTTVLVVDDDAVFRSILRDVLMAEGCQVVCAENGSAALEILGSITPDLILTDLSMPVMSGWELLAKLEADPRLANVPTTVFSAMPAESTDCMHAVLHKPLDISNLIDLLEVVALARPDRHGS
jgi:two-component system chemotaxis response regulator CheY